MGLAVLLPISVAAIALVDIVHLVHEAIENDHLADKAVQVDEAEIHRGAFIKAQKAQRQAIGEAYHQIAEDRASTFVEEVRTGNLRFGRIAGTHQHEEEPASGGVVVEALPAPSSNGRTGGVYPLGS